MGSNRPPKTTRAFLGKTPLWTQAQAQTPPSPPSPRRCTSAKPTKGQKASQVFHQQGQRTKAEPYKQQKQPSPVRCRCDLGWKVWRQEFYVLSGEDAWTRKPDAC